MNDTDEQPVKLITRFEEMRDGYKDTGADLQRKVSAQTGYNLTPIEILTLVYLHKLEKRGVKPVYTDLYRMLEVTPPQMTALYRRIEDIGLAKPPKSVKEDRRQRLIGTTKPGAEVAELAEEIDA